MFNTAAGAYYEGYAYRPPNNKDYLWSTRPTE
jgi:hypothetical protein